MRFTRTALPQPEAAPRIAVLTCAGCGQRWLVAGIRAGEVYACKACGHCLVVEPYRGLERLWRPKMEAL